MTTAPPQERPAAATPQAQSGAAAGAGAGRQIVWPGAHQERRMGMLLLGLALVVGAALGFWLLLQGVDERSSYLVASRDIERWEVIAPADLTVIEANVGTGSALTVEQAGLVLGRWATGRIPQGTILSAGMFDLPPLSSDEEAGKVLIKLNLSADEAPFGTLESGDTVALIGRESAVADGAPGDLSLLGLLKIEVVDGGDLYYVASPTEALAIKSLIDRYSESSDNLMLKTGPGFSTAELTAALAAYSRGTIADDFVADLQFGVSGAEPAEAPEPPAETTDG